MPTGFPSGATVGEVGEHTLLELIRATLGTQDVIVGIGDDAAVVAAPDARVVISTDVLVAEQHFKLAWSTARQIGTRVAAANLADITAMGARPTALVLTLVLPPETSVDWTMDFLTGVIEECERAGAKLVGGDLSAGTVITATGTAIGDLGGNAPVLRSGARVGDVVAVAGVLGWSAAGLAILSRGFSSPRILADAFRAPAPPYRAGQAAAQAGAHAMIDTSDGLLADAGHIATQSDVTIALASAKLPVDSHLRQAAAAFNTDALKWVLTGGEDHSFVATFAAGREIPSEFHVIGEVVAAGRAPVTVDGHVPQIAGGFDHFQRG